MKAIKISFGDWAENAIEVVELESFTVEGVKKHFQEYLSEVEDFESEFGVSCFEEMEFEISGNGFVLKVGESCLSEFGFDFLNIAEIGDKVITDNGDVFEEKVELKELEYEWNETEYSILTNINCWGDGFIVYKIVDLIERE